MADGEAPTPTPRRSRAAGIPPLPPRPPAPAVGTDKRARPASFGSDARARPSSVVTDAPAQASVGSDAPRCTAIVHTTYAGDMTTPAPRELPGFYYDPEKNRYFPIRGPIPGASVFRRNPPAPPYVLQVWKYQSTAFVADKALEQLYATVQTPEGTRASRMLVTGSMNGLVRFYGLESSLHNLGSEMEFSAQPAWPLLRKQRDGVNSALPSIWSTREAFVTFSSAITCVKKFGPCSSDAANTSSSAQRALVATLGSGGCGGSVYITDLSEIIDSSMVPQIKRVASLDRTVWAADCNSYGTQAALGMDNGASLLDLETEALLRICRSKSDILSLNFVHSGNVVLCGLRNGSIAPVDVRQKHHHHATGLPSTSTARRTVPMLPSQHNGRWKKQANKDKCSRAIHMSSAVCSLVALTSDENYFLGSSMDGSIKLFDLRLTKKGAIQSYEGHVNSHTNLPLVIDPSETLIMSGGEDCTVRIWSIKTGELIFAEIVADTLFTALCWPESSREIRASLPFDVNHSWGAWLGSRDGLFYMHGT